MMQYVKGDTTRLSANFHVGEFACRGKACCSQVLIDEKLVAYLQQIRDYFGKPVRVNSGYRCQVHNAAIGGAKASLHTRGQAADIVVEGVAPAAVARFAEEIDIQGIGLYETDADGYFVHIDTRAKRYFWYGQGEIPRESFGGYSFSRFVTQLQEAVGVTVDGIVGPETLGAMPTLGQRWNRQHPAVMPLQRHLAALGYTEVGEADGIAGKQFAAALAHYQTDHGLEDTGIAEQWGRTWHSLLGGSP